MPKVENPIGDVFEQIIKIMDYMVVKNKNEADKYETAKSARNASLYELAVTCKDNYLLYTDLFTPQMFFEVTPLEKANRIIEWIANPYNIPLMYQDHLLKTCRKKFIEEFVEENKYYRELNGLPPIDTKESDYITIPDELRKNLITGVTIPDVPIHEQEELYQDLLCQEEWFTTVLEKNPDKGYLRYLGKRKIDILTARAAKDFQIIRYIPIEDSHGINPYLIKDFSDTYNDYRDYVMYSLYNRDMESLYPNYRAFMSLLITLYTIMQVCNKAVGHARDFRFADDKVIATIFQMYGIEKNLIVTMTAAVQRKLVVAIMKLIRKKATNVAFYDLLDILGFDDVTISKLTFMKQQKFGSVDKDGNVEEGFYKPGQAVFSDGTPLRTFEDMDKLLERNEYGEVTHEIGLENTLDKEDPFYDDNRPWQGLPYFRSIDLKDANPYLTTINNASAKFEFHDITDPDPRWWDLDDSRDMVVHKNYTTADSKYIIVDSILRESDLLHQVIHFIRLILDNKGKTEKFMLTIPELFGSQQVSLFDLMVFLVTAMCYTNNLDGTILTSASGLLSVAGYNFNIDIAKFKEFLDKAEYADKERVLEFVQNMHLTNSAGSIKTIFEDVMTPFRDWLAYQLSQTPYKDEYVEYEKIYRATFSYDVAQSIFVKDFAVPIERLKVKYDISDKDMQDFQLFYPHNNETGKAIREEELADSKYVSFLDTSPNLKKTYFVDTGRGKLYFYDILNSPDLRYITNTNGTRSPNPLFWDANERKYDQIAINKAVQEIEALNPNQLANSYFKVDSFIIGDEASFRKGPHKDPVTGNIVYTYLPSSITAPGIFQKVLVEKIKMDLNGEAVRATTYEDYLRRKSPLLYDLLLTFDQSHDKSAPENDNFNTAVMVIVLAIEAELNMYLKVFEQGVAGNDTYFKTLVTLIKYFKSYMIDFTRCAVRYIIDNKVDAGGTSNMLKLFDEIYAMYWYMHIDDEFGLYDAIHQARIHLRIHDKSQMLVTSKNEDGYYTDVRKRETHMGSMRMVDEVKFFLNGKDKDSFHQDKESFWTSGEEDVGRFDMPDDHIDETYDSTQEVTRGPVDDEAWKEFTESAKM